MQISKLIEGLAPLPQVDFSEFGEVEVQPLSRYQALTGAFLGRNWVSIPHVTHNDDLDITDLEDRRQVWNAAHPDQKLTPVALLIKAMVEALRQMPQFNASLSADGQSIVLKRYFNIGVAVDTPAGLLVPVIRGCDAKPASQIASELAGLADKARSRGLSLQEMSGSSMALSSLGHIGGTSFSPIINAPDVAILGVTRTRDAPKRGADDRVVWRKVLPVSLSYDHRVINGADAARFVRCLGEALGSDALFG